MRHIAVRLLILLLCIAGLAAGPIQKKRQKKDASTTPAAQEPTQRSAMTFEEYDHLLNILFPIDHSSPLGVEYAIVLRFEPDKHPESQVTLRHWHDGHFEATFEQVLEGNAWKVASGRRVGAQMLDLQAIAHDVPTRKYPVMVSAQQFDEWHRQLFPTLASEFARVRRLDKAVRKTGYRDAVVNGTRYELWYIQGDDEIHAIAWDQEIGSLPTGEYALAKWASNVRWYASSHILAAPAPPAPALLPSANTPK